VLILLPPSDSKATVTRGRPLDLGRLSFPELEPVRAAVLAATIDVSAGPDPARRLGERPSAEDVVRRNVFLPDAPTATVDTVYTGTLHAALGASDLDAAARRRARSWIVVLSSLFGAVRLSDRIPTYRVGMCARLPALGHLTDVWREPLAEVLPGLAPRRGVVVDCRSGEYATVWRPVGELAARTVAVKVLADAAGSRRANGYAAKRTRGLLARRIVVDAIDPADGDGLAEALAAHFDVDLRPPARPQRPSELCVVASV
jgi:cytoplasmic iron level regulating protein YaaA (DUF328/UPF0246 family)